MAGWRDNEGRTASERSHERGTAERKHFMADVRYRPLTLLKGALGTVFVLFLVFLLISSIT